MIAKAHSATLVGNADECAFCRIVKGELPATVVYEDELTLGILPLEPIAAGHALLIPKAHCKGLLDVDEPTLAAVSLAAKRVAEQLVQAGATGVNLLHASGADAQQSVFHLHFHIVPRWAGDGLDLWIRNGLLSASDGSIETPR